MRVADIVGRIKASFAESAAPQEDFAGAEGRKLLDAYLAEARRKGNYFFGSPRELAAGRRILETDIDVQLKVLHAGFDVLSALSGLRRDWSLLYSVTPLLRQIGRRKLPFTPAGLLAVVRAMDAGKLKEAASADWLPYSAVLKAVEELAASGGLTPDFRQALTRTRPKAGEWGYITADNRRLIDRIDRILGESKVQFLDGKE